MLAFSINRDQLRDKWCVPAYRSEQLLAQSTSKRKMLRLKDVASISSGTYVRDYTATGETYLRVDNIRDFQLNENPEDLVYVDQGSQGVSERAVVKEHDVLVARTGTLGKAALAHAFHSGSIMSQHVTRLSCERNMLPGYLCCYLNSVVGKSQLNAGGFGSTRPELTHEALGEVKVPSIEWTSQQKIHKLVVDGLDIACSSFNELHVCVEEFSSLLSVPVGKLSRRLWFEVKNLEPAGLWTPRYHNPGVCEAVAELEEKYACVSLGEIADIRRGKGTRSIDYDVKGVPFIRTTSLINYGIDPFPDHYASAKTYESYNQPVTEGDILYSIEGKIGMCGYLSDGQHCVFKNHIERVRVKSGVDPVFLFLFLNTDLAKLQAYKNTVVQATLPGMASRLRELRIPMKPRRKKDSHRWQSLVDISDRARRALSMKSAAIHKWRAAKACLREEIGLS